MAKKNKTKENKEAIAEEQKHNGSSEAEKSAEINGEQKSADDKAKEAEEKYLRLYAEFDNYRRRTAKERLELISNATEELMVNLIPVIDDFERALKNMDESKEEVKPVAEGVHLIHKKFVRTLEEKGLKKMESPIGKELDTDFHEAITSVPAPDDKLKGKIIDEVECGYLLRDRVIRYAKVVVGE
jgi:molecular chaperone GrpE